MVEGLLGRMTILASDMATHRAIIAGQGLVERATPCLPVELHVSLGSIATTTPDGKYLRSKTSTQSYLGWAVQEPSL
jgi:hypothetical protein